MSDEHDGGLSSHYARVGAAEHRLHLFACGAWIDLWPNSYDGMREDVKLILRELEGLRQFDPR